MDDFTRSIFENAVLREQLAQKTYLQLSKRARSQALKHLFLKLAEEEQIHERLFQKFSLETLKIVNRTQLNNLNLLKNIKKEELFNHEIKDINNALDFAIEEEDKAYKDYSLLINHLEFGEVRQAFQEIARQELRHKTLLQKLKLEFNDDDWSSI
ncbi:ferritin family protein [Candidatus Woesearchaeota archaeon]|nr:ferritin family protein [Candidatus Woesearchaeota archaeon]